MFNEKIFFAPKKDTIEKNNPKEKWESLKKLFSKDSLRTIALTALVGLPQAGFSQSGDIETSSNTTTTNGGTLTLVDGPSCRGLTNAHVASSIETSVHTPTVKLENGKEYFVKVIYKDNLADLAAVQLEEAHKNGGIVDAKNCGQDHNTISHIKKSGEPIKTTGYPETNKDLSYDPKVTQSGTIDSARVTRKDLLGAGYDMPGLFTRIETTILVILTSQPVCGGQSGSPVLNSQGQLVGVLSVTFLEPISVEGKSYYVSIAQDSLNIQRVLKIAGIPYQKK